MDFLTNFEFSVYMITICETINCGNKYVGNVVLYHFFNKVISPQLAVGYQILDVGAVTPWNKKI